MATALPVGIYNYPDMKRGDSLRERIFEYIIDSKPAPIISAMMHFRDANDSLIYSVPIELIDNKVKQPTISPNITSLFPVGTLSYDVRITLQGGYSRTYVEGKIKILKDYSRV